MPAANIRDYQVPSFKDTPVSLLSRYEKAVTYAIGFVGLGIEGCYKGRSFNKRGMNV